VIDPRTINIFMEFKITATSARSLTKLARFLCVVTGKWDLLNTELVSPLDIPWLGIKWARYIYRSSWENGMITISAISNDEEYLTVYAFMDGSCSRDFRPLDMHGPEPIAVQPHDTVDKLVRNMVLRLSQLGFSKALVGTALIGQFEQEVSLNLGWCDLCLRTIFEDEEALAILGIDSTGKKALVYIESMEPLQFSSRSVEFAEKRFPEDALAAIYRNDDD